MTGRPLPRNEPVLRPAALADVEAMSAMINRYAAQGLMLPKSRTDLYRFFREYAVFTGPDGEVVACGGLRVYSAELAELVGLAVREDWRGRGLGPALVTHLLGEARGLGLARVIAMALDPAFYERLGFRAIPRAWVPEKEGADCRACPRSVGCTEVTMLAELAGAEAATTGPGQGRRARRRLRVLPAGAGVAGVAEPAAAVPRS